MDCPFLISTEQGPSCELKQLFQAKIRLDAWICEEEWDHLCPYFSSVLEQGDQGADSVPHREETGLPPLWRVRHVNRINGMRLLQEEA